VSPNSEINDSTIVLAFYPEKLVIDLIENIPKGTMIAGVVIGQEIRFV
jgi:hypothetical protein